MEIQASATSTVTSALASVFIAGFGVQQAVEIVGSVLSLIKSWDANVKLKKATLSFVALVIATVIVLGCDLDVLQPFAKKAASGATSASANCQQQRPPLDVFVTIIFVSAGTEGFNSLLKWLSYKKEQAKGSAADKKGSAAAKPVTVAPGGQKNALDLLPS